MSINARDKEQTTLNTIRHVYYFQAVDPLSRLKYSLTGSGEVHNSLGSMSCPANLIACRPCSGPI